MSATSSRSAWDSKLMVGIYLEQSLIFCLLAHSQLSCSRHSLGGSLSSGGRSESFIKFAKFKSHATMCSSDSCITVVFGIGWTSIGHEAVETFKS